MTRNTVNWKNSPMTPGDATMSDQGQQPVWNTVRVVIANVAAATADEAEQKLATALKKAGFDLVDASSQDPVSLGTFRAEDGTDAWGLPGDEPARGHGSTHCASCIEAGMPADYLHH